MSASTAKSVLANRALRWSSPCLFNDPFDVPRELSFGVTSREITNAFAQRLTSLIEHPPEDTSDLAIELRFVLDTMKRASAELRAEMIARIRDTYSSLRLTETHLNELRDLWRAWIPDFRILCLTESPLHAAMWFHYADQYRGAVLEFSCNDDLDSAWLCAQPVAYPENEGAVLGADDWANLLMMPNEAAVQTMFRILAYVKSSDWSYEHEWRIASFKRSTDVGLFTDYTFDRREVTGIYLGPLTTPADRELLISAAESYPYARVVEVHIGMKGRFSLHEIRDHPTRASTD